MNLDLIRSILSTSEDTMPGQRYQQPKIETRTDVRRPYYHIRPYVPVVTEEGMIRKRTSIFLGFVDETKMREAKERADVEMLTINNNRFVIQSQIPFQMVLDRYVEVRLPQIPHTADSYRNKIEKHIRPAFTYVQEARGKRLMRMCDIDKAMVEAWLNSKAAAGYSHNTLLDLRKVLSAIFSQAREWKMWSGENPCWRLQGKVGGKREVFPVTLPKDGGLQQFLGALQDTAIITAEGARLIVLLSLQGMARVCEVLALQVADIDLENETMRIERDWTRGRIGPTKTADSRRTRQIPGLAAEVGRYARGKSAQDFIFSRANGVGLPPDDRDLQQHVFRPAAKRAGIYSPGFGLRRFRHIGITMRQQEGAHPLETMKMAGHTKLSTTWIYTQTEEQREREQAEKVLTRVYGASVGGVQ